MLPAPGSLWRLPGRCPGADTGYSHNMYIQLAALISPARVHLAVLPGVPLPD